MSAWIAALQGQPFFGVALTLAAYAVSVELWRRMGQPVLCQPVLVATALLATGMVATGADYRHYAAQTWVLSESLALIIVLLAVPFYRHLGLIRASARALGVALAVGGTLAIASAVALPVVAGDSTTLLATIAPKSATAAVAIEIAERLGGVSGMTAVVVISTGLFGAIFGPSILSLLGVRDPRAVGFALGVASHALGTARAFQISQTAGTFAGLGLVLNALLTIALVPLCLGLLAP